MAVDVLVDIDPQKMRTLKSIEEVLKRIINFEREHGCRTGVVVIQRKQFPPLYEIVSQEEGEKWLKKTVSATTPEFGIKYYPRHYFEALQKRCRGNTDYPLPKPLSWEHYRTK